MPKYVIGPVKETPPGAKRDVRVGGLSIAVFNVDGAFYALNNRCPHQGAPLFKGTLCGRIDSTGPGEYIYDPQKTLVRCVWHGWEFDLATGKSWFDPERKRIKPYPVSVESGETIAEHDPASGSSRIPGPYVAETFPVSIEDDYLVVEVAK